MNIRNPKINGLSTNINPSNIQRNRKPNASFKDVLKEVGDSKVKFSGHALRRIEARNMNFNNDELNRLENAIARAEKKGVRDAVIMMDGKILITNISTKTIITTFNEEQLKEQVFTNIDGAVIA